MKVKLCFLIVLIVVLLAGCTISNEQITTDSSDKEQIEFTVQIGEMIISDQLVQSLIIDENYEAIQTMDGRTLHRDDALFLATPLQRYFLSYLDEVNNQIEAILSLSCELLQSVAYYKDGTYTYQMADVKVLADSIEMRDGVLSAKYLKYELASFHPFVGQQGIDEDVIVEINWNQSKISITSRDEEYVWFDYQVSNKQTLINSKLNHQTLKMDLQNTSIVGLIYQSIALSLISRKETVDLYFYGNNNYGAILLNYQTKDMSQGVREVSDFEVFKRDKGLLYKSQTYTDVSGTERFAGGFTLNVFNEWTSFTQADGVVTITLPDEVYQTNQLNERVIDINDRTVVFTREGFVALDMNLPLYGEDAYYVAGFFSQSKKAFEDSYRFVQFANNAPSVVPFNTAECGIVDTHISRIRNLVNKDVKLNILYRELIEHHNETDREIIILRTKEGMELIILNAEGSLLMRRAFQGGISYLDGQVYQYHRESDGTPYVAIFDFIKKDELSEVTRIPFQFLKGIAIIRAEKKNGGFVFTYQTEAGLTGTFAFDHEHEDVVLHVDEEEATLIDSQTGTKAVLFKSKEGGLLLALYRNNQLTQLSAGDINGGAVLLNGYLLSDNRLLVYGSREGFPYFASLRFTNLGTIDNDASLSFQYYLEGVVNSMSFDPSNKLYTLNMRLDEGGTVRQIHVDEFGKIHQDLVRLGYLTDWSNWDPKDEKFKKLNFINYSFLYLSDKKDGTVLDTLSKGNNIRQLKENYPHLNLLISIGGWGADHFSEAAMTEENRKRFSETAIEIMLKYGFNGIDIDWEYPTSGSAGISHSPKDKQNFTLMLKQVREDLNKLSEKTGEYYYLTIAAGAFMGHGNEVELLEIIKYVDFINVMTYDMEKWVSGGRRTSHHTNLYNTNKMSGQYGASFYINNFLRNGVPAEKLNLGIAFYGRGAKDMNFVGGDVFDKFFTNRQAITWTYTKIKEEILDNPNTEWILAWDDAAKSPYAYTSSMFISFDNPESIRYKIEYVKEHGLGGVFFWEFSQDATGELIDAIDRYIHED